MSFSFPEWSIIANTYLSVTAERQSSAQQNHQHQYCHFPSGARVYHLPLHNQSSQRALQEEAAHPHSWRDHRGHRVHGHLVWFVVIKAIQGPCGWEHTNRVGRTRYRFKCLLVEARVLYTYVTDVYRCCLIGYRLRPPAAPNISLLPNLVTDSFAIAIVGFSMDVSLAKIFALKHGYSVDGNQVSVSTAADEPLASCA